MAIRASGMSIGEIFRESFELYKKNPIITIPSLLPVLWLLIMSIISPAVFMALFASDPYMTGGYLAMMAGYVVFFLVFIFLFLIAEAMTVEMIRQAYDEGRTHLGEAFRVTLERLGPLLLGTLLVTILVSVGEFLFVLPGLILMFLFWFVPQAIIIDEEGGFGCLGRSIQFFRENAGDAFLIGLLSIVLYGVLVLLTWIPVIGAILMFAGMPYLVSLSTLLYIDRA